jgi:hypothetical protein
VWNTVVATQMTDFDGHNFAAPEEALDCANRGEPPVVLFFDDMEHRTDSWVRSNSTYWQQIPSREITYTYAAHGVGSMNGWTDVGQTGNGTYVEMASPVALPADKPAFVNFNHSLTRSRTGVIGVSIYIQANGGGWTLLTGPSTGMGVPDGHIFAPTPGFGSTRIDLTAWMGQSVKVRFVVDSPSNNLVDWYMDDFKIGYCDNRTGAPWRTAGYRTVSGIHLDWTDPYYKPQPFTWDLTYTPAIPGAPASVPSDPSGQYALDLPGADPNITYTITIAAHGGDGRIGEPATIKVLHGPPVSCPTHAPVPLYPAFTGLRRPMPGLPEGSCVRPVTPRR